MNKEELEKRAKEYASTEIYYGAYVDTGAGMEIVEEAYIDAAERETKLLQGRVATLEKENAELKERNRELLESCEGATMMYKDLCKAKELLDEFLDFESSCMERGIYISDKIRAEAEQFLKEN